MDWASLHCPAKDKGREEVVGKAGIKCFMIRGRWMQRHQAGDLGGVVRRDRHQSRGGVSLRDHTSGSWLAWTVSFKSFDCEMHTMIVFDKQFGKIHRCWCWAGTAARLDTVDTICGHEDRKA